MRRRTRRHHGRRHRASRYVDQSRDSLDGKRVCGRLSGGNELKSLLGKREFNSRGYCLVQFQGADQSEKCRLAVVRRAPNRVHLAKMAESVPTCCCSTKPTNDLESILLRALEEALEDSLASP